MLMETNLFKNKKYIVGVSGGPDSMALLDLLNQRGYQLMVCHVNYHKRKDSDLDYEVVNNYCEKNHLPLAYLEIFHYDEGNFQAQARNQRYDFYQLMAQVHHYDGVILAHHLDDHLETVIMQKESGRNDALWGIREVSDYHGLPILRPVLHLTKQQLLDYCHEHHLDYRIDSSNLENDYTRNKVRHFVLSQYTQEAKEALFLEAQRHNQMIVAREIDCLNWLEEHVVDDHFSFDDFKKERDQETILKLFCVQKTALNVGMFSSKMMQTALKSLNSQKGNVTFHLPQDFLLIKEYDCIYVTKLFEDVSYCFQIEKKEVKDFGYFKIAFEGHDRCGIGVRDEDFPLTIRTFKEGDVIQLSYGHKKLSRLFIDAKIPKHLRATWPVVLNCRQEIILVPKIAKNYSYLLAKPIWFVIQ